MAGNHVRISSSFDDKVSNKLAKIRDNFDRLGKTGGFKALAQGVGLGVGQAAFNLLGDAAAGAVGFMQDSIKAASDLNESLSKSNVVFGDAAHSIETFGKGAAKSLGLSEQAAVEAAATFGNFFTGLGESQGKAAEMSKRIVTLAGDLASFNNIGTDVALEKLRSGLAGEAEPLRTVGVFLSDAKVKAKGMKLGLADAHGELSEGAKVLARYQIILDETKTAQGDFARTSDQLANSQRIANAELTNSQAALGTQLLPAQLSVTKAQINLFTNLENFGDLLAGKVTPGALGLAVALNQMTLAEAEAKLAAERAATVGDRLASVIGDDSKAALTMVTSIGRANDVLGTHAYRNRLARQEVEKLTDAHRTAALDLIDQFYDPILLHDQQLAVRSEQRAQRQILADKKANSEAKREARARLHELDKEAIELEVKLLAVGKLSKKGQEDLLDRLKDAQRKATGESRKQIDLLIAKVKELQKLQGTGVRVTVNANFNVGKDRGRAHGGPVLAGETYTVGERGPETLVMGDRGGYVIPNGGNGGTRIIQVVLPGLGVIAEAIDDYTGRSNQRSPATAF